MKCVWKSKSFITGLASIVTGIALSQGVEFPEGVVEGLFSVMGVFLAGKSVCKRRNNGK